MKNRSKWIALVLLIMWAAPLTCNAQAWHSVQGEALRSGLSGLRSGTPTSLVQQIELPIIETKKGCIRKKMHPFY